METISNLFNLLNIKKETEDNTNITEEFYTTNKDVFEIIFKDNNNKKHKKSIKKIIQNNTEKKITEIKANDNNKKALWESIKNPSYTFTNEQKNTNLSIPTSQLFNKGFLEFMHFYGFHQNTKLKNTFITSGNKSGKYSLNFSNTNINNHINKVSLTKWCSKSPYYPNSFLIENKEQLKNLQLNNNKMYFVKPARGEGSKNIAISIGKNLQMRPEIIKNTPLIFQQNVDNLRLFNNRKQDERIYVLFIKTNTIKTYLYKKGMVRTSLFPYTKKISIKSHFTLPCNVGKVSEKKIKSEIEINRIKPLIKDIASKLIPHLTQKLDYNHKAEFWLTGWDIIFDTNNHPWLLEINPTPNQCESYFARTLHYQIYQEILDIIMAMEYNKQLPLKDFIEI